MDQKYATHPDEVQVLDSPELEAVELETPEQLESEVFVRHQQPKARQIAPKYLEELERRSVKPTKKVDLQLPNLIIGGVHKAGTTSLYRYLSWHPAVARSIKKELHYYTPIRYGAEPDPLSKYRNMFPARQAGEEYLMEASPSYLYGGADLAARINSDLDDARVIMIIREPAARFVSFYKHLQATLELPESESLEEFATRSAEFANDSFIQDEYHQRGMLEGHYLRYLPEWHQVFGNRLRVVFFEDLIKRPTETMMELAEWLDIDPEFYAETNFTQENRTTHYSNRFFHSIAVQSNRALEPILRRSHGAKKLLRKLYYALNSGKLEQPIGQDVIGGVREHYANSNRELATWLTLNGYPRLPDWLRTA